MSNSRRMLLGAVLSGASFLAMGASPGPGEASKTVPVPVDPGMSKPAPAPVDPGMAKPMPVPVDPGMAHPAPVPPPTASVPPASDIPADQVKAGPASKKGRKLKGSQVVHTQNADGTMNKPEKSVPVPVAPAPAQ